MKVSKTNYWLILLIGVVVVSLPTALLLPKPSSAVVAVVVGSVWGHLCHAALGTT